MHPVCWSVNPYGGGQPRARQPPNCHLRNQQRVPDVWVCVGVGGGGCSELPWKLRLVRKRRRPSHMLPTQIWGRSRQITHPPSSSGILDSGVCGWNSTGGTFGGNATAASCSQI